MLLYVLNTPRLSPRRLVFLLLGFWTLLLTGGYVGLLLPNISFRSAAEILLPQSLVETDFVYTLVHPRVSEVQDFIGYRISRPSAPFFYTNWWGANFSALIPIVLAALALIQNATQRKVIIALLALSVAPVVLSVNRGVWLSLSVGAVYSLARFIVRGNLRAAGRGLALLAILAAVLAAGPLRKTIDDRLDNPASNRGRFGVIHAALDGAKESPLLGHGVPQRAPKSLRIPTVGTGGLIWQVIYTTGFGGLTLFGSWLVWAIWSTRGGISAVSFWGHISIVMIVVQMFYYSMIPVELHLLMLITALTWRERGGYTRRDSEDRLDTPVLSNPSQALIAT